MVRLTDRPDMTLDVYRGRKTTKQQQPSYTAAENGFFKLKKKKQQKTKMNLENLERSNYVVWVYLQISATFLFGQYFMGYR